MYKEKFQDILTENFLNGKISVDKFISLSESIEVVTEKKLSDIASKLNISSKIKETMFKIKKIKSAMADNGTSVAKKAELDKLMKKLKILKASKAALIVGGSAAVGGYVGYKIGKKKK